MQREEIEAMWEKLREHEQTINQIAQDTLQVARDAAFSIVLSTYNLGLAFLAALGEAKAMGSYIEYMQPRCLAASETTQSARNSKEAFKVAEQFESDCLDYLKTRR